MTDKRPSNTLAEVADRRPPAAGREDLPPASAFGRRSGGARAHSAVRPSSALRAAFWTLGDRLVTLVLGAVMTAHLARYLGVAGYGYYTLVITFVTLFVLIIDLANAQVVVREIAGRPEQTRRVIATALLLRALLALFAASACVLCAWTMDYPPPVRTAIAVYSVILLLAPTEALAAILQARLRLGALSLVGAGATLVNLALIFLVVRVRASLPLVMAAAAAPTIVRAIATTILVIVIGGVSPAEARRREGRAHSMRFDTALARRLLAASWPLALATLLNLVPSSLPTFCLAKQQVPLGTFAAAARVPMMLALLPNAAMVGLFPVMARAYLVGREEATAVLHRAYIAMLGMAFPISAGAVALAPDGIHLLYGHDFAASVPGLRVLSLALIAMFPGIAAGHMLIAMGRERVSLGIAVGGGALAALLTPWLCHHHGADGAAASVAAVTLAMAAASTSSAWWFLRTSARRSRRGYPAPSPLSELCLPVALQRIVGCALVMTGVVLVLRRAGLFVAMGGGAAIYTFCVWKTSLLAVALRFPSLESLQPADEGNGTLLKTGPTFAPSPIAQRLRRRLDDALAAAYWRVCYWQCKAALGAWRLALGPTKASASRLAGRHAPVPAKRQASSAKRRSEATHIVVLDRDYIGDVVCITPVLRALRARFPDAVITLAVAPGVAPLFAGHPDVDRVVALSEGQGLRGARRLRRELSALAPQSIVVGLGTVPANAWLGHLAGALCRAEVRLGEAHGRYRDLLTHSVTRSVVVRHWAQIHLDVLVPLGVESAPTRPTLATTPESRAALQRYLDEAVQGAGASAHPRCSVQRGECVEAPDLLPDAARSTLHAGTERSDLLPRPWIALHPGGRIYHIPDPAAPGGLATVSRRWPAERFGLLARHLAEACGGTLFFTGGPDDAPATDVVRAALEAHSPVGVSDRLLATGPASDSAACGTPCAVRCIDTTGQLSLAETAALIEACDLFVTSDTGPMHLAFALEVPTVAIFGPTDPRRAGPVNDEEQRHRVLRPRSLACSPCAGEALVPCHNPSGQECLTAVSAADAFTAAMELLENGSTQPDKGTG